MYRIQWLESVAFPVYSAKNNFIDADRAFFFVGNKTRLTKLIAKDNYAAELHFVDGSIAVNIPTNKFRLLGIEDAT